MNEGGATAGEGGAADAAADTAKRQPRGWRAHLELPVAEDTNPDPDIVEVALEASERMLDYGSGTATRVYAYNGSVPGPRIEGKVGDKLIVHFTNSLPEETTVHWHGLELPATEDGSLISQLPVEPGGTRTYEFDLVRASTYWYHPHIRGHVQVEKGLYGPLIVRDPQKEEQELGLPQDELVVMLDDVLLDDAQQIAPAFPDDSSRLAERSLNGREGDVLLLNGQQQNSLQVVSGVPIRLRLINAANSRFFRLSMSDATLYKIGVDGGLLSSPSVAEPIGMVPHIELEEYHNLKPSGSTGTVSDPDPKLGVTLTPGQRVDLVFTPRGEPGTVVTLESHDMHRGRHTVTTGPGGFEIGHAHADGEGRPEELMRFEIVEGGDADADAYVPSTALRAIERLDTTDAEKLTVMFGHSMPDLEGKVSMFATMVDGKGVPFEQLTAEQALQAKVGETYIYEVVNMSGGDHPFHPHGFVFQPIEIEYVDEEHPERNEVVPFDTLMERDTIRVPARRGLKGTSRTILRAAVRFDDEGREGRVEAFGKTPTETTSGGWLVHCHILEHAKLGMMTFVNLRE